MPPKSPAEVASHATRLGFKFRNAALAQQALTHRSYLNEHPESNAEDNERLEFLGDAVLAFLAAEWLYRTMPGDQREGVLTRLRAALVRNEALAAYAQQLRIGEAMLMGRGEEEGGGRARRRNLGGAFEALVGALYLDQDLDAVRAFVHPFFRSALEAILREQSDKDARSRLQEWSQVALGVVPGYQVIEVSGPEHAPLFTVQVVIGDSVYGRGEGSSKQAAAQAAAQAALADLAQKGAL